MVDMRLEGSGATAMGEVSLTADSVRLSGRDAGAVVARAHTAQGKYASTWSSAFQRGGEWICHAPIAAALDRRRVAE